MFAASVQWGRDMKKRVGNYVIVHFVFFFRHIPEDDEDDGISPCSLLRSSTSFFHVAINPYRLPVPCHAMPVRVSVSSFIHTLRHWPSTGQHQIFRRSGACSFRTARDLCLPKSRFYSRTEGVLYIKEDHNGRWEGGE
jgi:hypothetical protein